MMKTRMTLGLCALGLVAMGSTGCANNETQERISMLESTNRSLTDRLNRAMGDLGAANRDRTEWDRALATARREANDLRSQMANMPTPAEAAPGWTAVPGGAMIAIEGSVLFSAGKTVVRDQARRALDSIASVVQGDYGDKDILVFGHTDAMPIKKSGWKDNWQLSTERALAVVRYLAGRGVSSSRLVACGCGEHRPLGSNSAEAGRRKNRRVEIFAIEPQAQTGRP